MNFSLKMFICISQNFSNKYIYFFNKTLKILLHQNILLVFLYVSFPSKQSSCVCASHGVIIMS